jgi:VWFA-related protein
MLCALLTSSSLSYSQEPKFSVTSRLVVVSVIVNDRDGKPIENLRAEDFTLLEDNKPQKISVFEYQRLGEPTRAQLLTPPPPPSAVTTPKPPAASAKATVEQPPTVRYKDRRLLVLFFDFSSMPPEDQIRAQQAGIKFVEEQITPADVVSIMTFTSRLNVAQEFTADRERLLSTIKSFRIGDASELAAEGTTEADDTDESLFTADETEFNIFNTDRKLGALESAAKMLGGFPEKKALVYFSSGVGKTGVENQSQLRATVNAAVRANLSFYPVDARGLVATAPLGNASAASPRGTGMYTGQAQRQQRERFNDQQETLYTLAADTGGKALLDSNDLSLGIVQAQRDISSYYILGYYSSNADEDGRFRRVRVRLDRHPQAKLDYRSGYFAPKQWRDFNSSDKERQLEEALMLGDPITDLPLALEVNWFRLLPDRYFVPVAVKIAGSALELARKRGGEETELDFIGQIKDEKGRPQGSLRDAIKVKLVGEQAAKLTQRHLQYDAGFVLAPGKYSLRFLARENQTGKMGTFETSFVVADIAQQQGYLKMSSVVWSNQREPLEAAVGAADRNRRMTMMHPLVSEGRKLVPSITRVFRRDQNLYVYFEVYDPVLNGAASGVRASVSFYRGKLKAFETKPVEVSQAAPRRQAVRVQVQVPLDKLEPGNYLCQVSAVDQVGKKFGFARAPIVLLAK